MKLKLNENTLNLLKILLNENSKLEELMRSNKLDEVRSNLKKWVLNDIGIDSLGMKFFKESISGEESLQSLSNKEIAAIRILDYLENTGLEVKDFNFNDLIITIDPIKHLWIAINEKQGEITTDFLEDMIHLFRQFENSKVNKPLDGKKVESLMNKYPSGLDDKIIEIRKKNKNRIIKKFIGYIDSGKIKKSRYVFDEGTTLNEKIDLMNLWWDEDSFHLQFAIRDPETLNDLLDNSLSTKTMEVLKDAKDKKIPFFVNPYYLSLLDTSHPCNNKFIDQAVRDYIVYGEDLVCNFGKIRSWEKEDIVEIGKPNAAGWLLPTHSIHRRYPEVAIMIPRTQGRACGGLCSSCQRFYGFQSGVLNFDLDALKPNTSWVEELGIILNYFEKDSQLRDILITGGDALMSTDSSLQIILDEIYKMVKRKADANKDKEDGSKFAEILRIRLGTRLPVYLPQRITDNLIDILGDFKKRAREVGVKQFVIQTHFQSSYELTPEAEKGIKKLLSAGWMVTNQNVFTSASSRVGHIAKLRFDLNNVGVMTYYTFSVKGGLDNRSMFATNARLAQEIVEEKNLGKIPRSCSDKIKTFPLDAENIISHIQGLKDELKVPFLATDRSVLNLPGVGKSITFRVIGLTKDGRRVLRFGHDATRIHSPIIEKMPDIVLVESRSIQNYLDQMVDWGEELEDYGTLWYYSIGETERREPVFEYPEYDFENTSKMTNLKI